MKIIAQLKSASLLITAGLLLTTAVASAQLKIGDAAPKLQVGQWIQGEPVTTFNTNHIYIIEFWATWCGPCRQSIPHLNELAEKFKDKGVIVIGQDTWDNDSAVAPFMKTMGDKMTYRVALDDKRTDTDGFMSTHWWKRGGGHGIPNAFIINQQGVIAWIGHPMALQESVINEILSGHYDLTQAAAAYAKGEAESKEMNALNGRLFTAIKQKQWADAATALDDLLQKYPAQKKAYDNVRFQVLLGQKKSDEAYQLATAISDAQPKNAELQNSLAWTIATQAGVEPRNLTLAEKFAQRAVTASNGKDAAPLDTLARVQFLSGNKTGAITTEQKAVDAASAEEQAALKKCLADYIQGQLPAILE